MKKLVYILFGFFGQAIFATINFSSFLTAFNENNLVKTPDYYREILQIGRAHV